MKRFVLVLLALASCSAPGDVSGTKDADETSEPVVQDGKVKIAALSIDSPAMGAVFAGNCDLVFGDKRVYASVHEQRRKEFGGKEWVSIDTATLSNGQPGSQGEIKSASTAEFFDYGKPVKVAVPEPADVWESKEPNVALSACFPKAEATG